VIRVIAGEFGGRRLKTPAGDKTRPTADRVRESWFNILQQPVVGAHVLDLFAGSGALGLEALSRGATHADFVESNRAALVTIKANITTLQVTDRTTIHRADALQFAAALRPAQYDIVFADPPYGDDAAPRLAALFRLTPFARILSIEHASDDRIAGDDTRRYGDTAVTFMYAP
jgi:16S rRNA (guanine966-N2)-methyltransferase